LCGIRGTVCWSCPLGASILMLYASLAVGSFLCQTGITEFHLDRWHPASIQTSSTTSTRILAVRQAYCGIVSAVILRAGPEGSLLDMACTPLLARYLLLMAADSADQHTLSDKRSSAVSITSEISSTEITYSGTKCHCCRMHAPRNRDLGEQCL